MERSIKKKFKTKLQQYYGSRISILDESSGSGFVCASTVPLGDAIAKLKQFERDRNINKAEQTLIEAAKILRKEAINCKKYQKNEESVFVSSEAASRIVPDPILNFTTSVLSKVVLISAIIKYVIIIRNGEYIRVLTTKNIILRILDIHVIISCFTCLYASNLCLKYYFVLFILVF